MFPILTVIHVSAQEGERRWWPQFRGPDALGIAEGGAYPITLGSDDNLLWKAAIPAGVSSPCIWDDRIFVTAHDRQRGVLETICLDRHNGVIVWRRDAPTKEFEKVHLANSPASATPVSDGKKVYVYFGSYGLLCYDFDGNLIWDRPLGVAKNRWGMGTSPVLVKEKLILSCEQGGQHEDSSSFLIAVDARSGDLVWKTNRPNVGSGWSTPILWKRGETSDLIIYSRTQVVAFGIDDGSIRWTVNELPSTAVATPVVGSGLLFVSGTTMGGDEENPIVLPSFEETLAQHDENGDGLLSQQEVPEARLDPRDRAGKFVLSLRSVFVFIDTDKNKLATRKEWDEVQKNLPKFFKQSDALVAIRPGGSGDLTETNIAWTVKRGIPDNPSPLHLNGRVYLAKSGGIISCFAAESGELLYRKRAGVRGNISASPVAASGKIYVCSERGDVAVLEDGNEFSELSRCSLGERIMATPALADGHIFIRTDDHLYAFAKE